MAVKRAIICVSLSFIVENCASGFDTEPLRSPTTGAAYAHEGKGIREKGLSSHEHDLIGLCTDHSYS